MTNELESMSYQWMLKWQWEHVSLPSLEYDRPQFEQITISSMCSPINSLIKTSQIQFMGDQVR